MDIMQMKHNFIWEIVKVSQEHFVSSIQKKSEIFLDTVLQLSLSFCKYLVFFLLNLLIISEKNWRDVI